MGSKAELREVISALRTQGWEVALTGDQQKYKATPPEKGKRVVMFSALPSSPHTIVSITRELRQSGFEWPPPEKRQSSNILPIHGSTPFAPRPHPEVATVSEEEADKEEHASLKQPATQHTTPQELSAPPAKTKPPTRPKGSDEDVMYLELKEAKALVDLAAQDLLATKEKLTAAQAAHDAATQEYESALTDLRKKKKAFDALFEEEHDA